MATPPEVDQDQMFRPNVAVPDFYANRSVFITGGTGFMGKVLVEKLLRSCPAIKNIYLLIRPKRGQDVNARLQDLLNAPLFEKMRKEKPHELTKVIPICGDITSEELGISESDQAMLFKSVSIVFHSAATVKFDEKLKLSVTINMLGTKRMVELCRRMTALDALVHVSTAYCNCDQPEINETIYPTPYNPDDIIRLINWLPEDMLDKLTPSLIGKRPNTYTFTKALAEQMLLNEVGKLPVAIVRPSIVVASYKEPMPGWLDNWNGPTGIVSAVGNGMYRTIICEKDYVVDLVPVDIVINMVIVAAWRTALKQPYEIPIYNCCTSRQNPITWHGFVNTSIQHMIKHPMEGCLWYPTGCLRMNRFLNTVHGYFAHYVPAYLLDLFTYVIGKRPIMVNVQNKLGKAVECLEYFTTHQWRWNDDNVQILLRALTEQDRETFQFDVKSIDWNKYVEIYVLGFREFLFKQSPTSLPRCRTKMARLYYLHQITKLVLVLITWRFLMARSKKLRDLWTRFFGVALQLARLLPFAQ